MHDETKLPKWTQTLIENLRREIQDTQQELARTREAHAILHNHKGWFPINGPTKDDKTYHLWILNRDDPFPICSLGPNDILLVGRSNENE